MAKELIALDIETTGLDPRKHEVIEIGAVHFDIAGKEIRTFESFAKPEGTIPFAATKIHGIKMSMVETAPTAKEAWEKLLDWSGDCTTFVSHNAPFECGFIQALYSPNDTKPDIHIIDTLRIARQKLRGEKSYQLSELIKSESNCHRALPDARAVMHLFLKLQETYASKRIPKSYCVDFWKVDYFKTFGPSERQLNYISRLGGDTELPKTKSEASDYIDTLKSTHSNSTNDHLSLQPQRRSKAALIFGLIFVFILFVYWN